MAKLISDIKTIKVNDVISFTRTLKNLGLCEIACTKCVPENCDISLDNEKIIRIVKNHASDRVNLEIEVDDIGKLYLALKENKIDYSNGKDAIFFNILGIIFKVTEIPKTDCINFEFEGKKYIVNANSLPNNKVQLPDGRVLRVTEYRCPPYRPTKFTVIDLNLEKFAQALSVYEDPNKFTCTITKYIGGTSMPEIENRKLPDGRTLVIKTHIE